MKTQNNTDRMNPAADAAAYSFLEAEARDLSNVTLDSSAGMEEIRGILLEMGYDLGEEDIAKIYENFKRSMEEKSFIGIRELDAIVASTAMQVPSTYRIKNYVIMSGNVITATANIMIEKNGEVIRGLGTGDGPIDAAFRAIEEITGHHYELVDFQIQTMTEGRDAMGSALVKLRAGGKLYSGTGMSTDIIGAAILAYISVLNKITYEKP